jgi:PleD family two-component response regulator
LASASRWYGVWWTCGGSVAIRSDGQDQGSEFTVRLPAAPSKEAAAAPPLARDRPQQVPALDAPILVVDDNHDAAESMAVLLRMEGYPVHIAYDGPTALQAVEALRPRAVLLDLGLPGIDGFRRRTHPEPCLTAHESC